MFALGTDSFVVAGVLPELSHTFQVSIGAAGQMATVYAVTYGLLSPTIAALAAAVPRKRLLMTGLTVFVIANVATAFAPTFGAALIARAFAGLGAAIFSPTALGAAPTLVPPERRAHALSVVVAGLTAATALGSPTGAVIGGLGDWRWTMAFVAALGVGSAVGILTLLPEIPLPPAVPLRKRMAPFTDLRVSLTLATTLLTTSGIFTVYTYFSVVFDRVLGDNPLLFGGLLVLMGVAGTLANLAGGRFIDKIGNRKLLLTTLLILFADFALLPWTGAYLWTAALAVFLWGAGGWGSLVPQQHRLVTLMPHLAPVVLGLNTMCTYLGATAAGLIGAVGLHLVGAHALGWIAAALVGLAVLVSELATAQIKAAARERAVPAASRA
jgi:predicted MFS family arabinose efflux permease